MPEPVIKLTGFIGEQPRVIPRNMPEMAAQSAINTRLDDTGLTPIRASTLIEALSGIAAPKTIYLHGSDWLAWETMVHAVPGPVAQDRLYFTGDGVPKMRVSGTEYDLKVPRPATALTVASDGLGSGDVTSRVYVYTWVTSFGEESEPSPASAAVDFQPGDTFTLSAFETIPTGRGIAKQRIYRTQTGSQGTDLYLIAERDAATGNFTDDIDPDEFGEILPSRDYNQPPDGLSGLTELPNGMMAGFVGKALYFCEPYLPHAWPEKFIKTFSSNIVGLAALGGTLVVLTDRQPSLAAGATPESMQDELIEQNLPCINARGIVDLGYVVAYPSNEGLVTIDASGAARIATANIFDRDGWLALNPETMTGGQYAGRYVAFYSTTGAGAELIDRMLMIDLSGQSFLIRANVAADAAFFDIETGALYYVERGTTAVKRFDAPNAARLSQFWKSKEFVLPHADNFGALRVEATGSITDEDAAAAAAQNAIILAANEVLIAGGDSMGALGEAAMDIHEMDGDALEPLITLSEQSVVTVYADGTPIAHIADANRIVRLPAGFLARKWEISVSGTAKVEQITMAKTVNALRRA